jgi:ketosteroid isomerase-like protein
MTTTTTNEELIKAYFRMVEEDDYAGFGSILTEDATWTMMPSGHTWTGRRAVESAAMAAGRGRRHDERSHIEIKHWFTDGEHFCVEYTHKAILPELLGLRLTLGGFCLVFHMRDGRFDALREYINPPNIAARLFMRVALLLLPYLSRRRLARS